MSLHRDTRDLSIRIRYLCLVLPEVLGIGADVVHRPCAPVLERLVLTRVPQGGRILDLCCGTGQLVGELMRRGYHVMGVDGSEQMLGFARANAPGAEFVHDDVRTMTLPSSHDAAVCLFDSLNHLLRPDEVETAFRNVRAAVTSGAPFLCDFNMEPIPGSVARILRHRRRRSRPDQPVGL